MTNRTQALGRRLIGALKNENVLTVIQGSLNAVALLNAKTGKCFAIVTHDGTGYSVTLEQDHWFDTQDFVSLITAVKADVMYPKAKDRTPKATVKTHGAPKYVGISMGSFKPEAGF